MLFWTWKENEAKKRQYPPPPPRGKRSFSLTCAHGIGRCRSHYHTITSTAAPLVVLEEFEDIKGVIGIRKSKDIQ